ncbi:MAG: DUF1294 domain-containing protein [Ruminococcus sp.]|nr:DUF1294 domain-containing protein [Ruminococcus sp.]
MDKMIFLYLLVMNLLTFAMFGIDKWKAVHGNWRIRESTLLGLSLVGGAAGGLAAMYVCRHKTKKVYFKTGLPAMLAIQAILLFYLLFY